MKKIFFIWLTGFLLCFNLFSQSAGVSDFMRLNPYSTLNNPAYFIPYRGYFAIPGISNINLSLYNTGFHYDKIFDTKGKGEISVQKFINSLPNNNWLNLETNLEILGIGFRAKKLFFSLGYRLNVDGEIRYNKQLFEFLLPENIMQNNSKDHINFMLEPNLNIYQEVSLGIQARVLKNFYIGIRPKVLFGLVNIDTRKLNGNVYYQESDTNITIRGYLDSDVKMSAFFQYYNKDENGKLSFTYEDITTNIRKTIGNCFSKNMGVALDFGIVFRINQQFRVSASFTDLGYIKWKGFPLNIKAEKADFEIAGFNFDKDFFYFKDILTDYDSALQFNPIKSYKSLLTPKVMADFYFDITPSNRLILQFKGYIIGKSLLPKFSFAYNGTFFNIFDVVASYSIMKQSYLNLGVGFGIRLGPLHLYAGTDNIFSAINFLNADKINATFGLLFDFPVSGKKIKEERLKSMFKTKEEKIERKKDKQIAKEKEG